MIFLPPSSALCGFNLILLPCYGYNCLAFFSLKNASSLRIRLLFLHRRRRMHVRFSLFHYPPLMACPGYCSLAPFWGRKRSVQQSVATAASHYVCGCPSSLSYYRNTWLIPYYHMGYSSPHVSFLAESFPSYEPRHRGFALLVILFPWGMLHLFTQAFPLTFYCFVIDFSEEVLLPSGTGGFAFPFTG